uniref:GB1/RHD3-type G domain-containing protein n=1 Tax=Erythrolobus australicus TaxID=1077150 RepID=A0A7S1XIK5_9RHOD
MENRGYAVAAQEVMALATAADGFDAAGCDAFCAAAWPASAAQHADADADEEVDARCVAVLGARSSGKSTLLNALFGAKFEVSRPYPAKPSTASAMDIAAPDSEVVGENFAQKPIALLDTHVVSERERDRAFEHRLVCFAVAVSNVIVFNAWTADIGRYEAAGYGMLRTMFAEYGRMHLKADARRTALIIVLRDHDDESSLASLNSLLRADIEKVWADVMKAAPPQLKDNGYTSSTRLDELFELSISSLPHARYRKAAFDEALAHLRDLVLSKLDAEEFSKTIPAEAFATYAEVVWSDIESATSAAVSGGSENSAGGSASQVEIVASYRSDAAFHEQHAKVMKTLSEWHTKSDRGSSISSFGVKASELLSSTLAAYDDAIRATTSSSAATTGQLERRDELEKLLHNNIRAVFNKQVLLLQNKTLQRFKAGMVRRVAANGIASSDQDAAALDECEQWFARHAQDLVVPSMSPALNIAHPQAEVAAVLRDFAARFVDSPTVQLQSMRRLQREANRPPPAYKKLGVGVSLTGAIRPRGTGNFQAALAYARMGHRLNLVVCNDADVAEQGGEGPVPLFRVQPALNIDLSAK